MDNKPTFCEGVWGIFPAHRTPVRFPTYTLWVPLNLLSGRVAWTERCNRVSCF